MGAEGIPTEENATETLPKMMVDGDLCITYVVIA